MAASNLNLGKASGGVLNIQPADGTTNTSLVLPASGVVVATDVAVTDNAIARYDGTTGKVQNSGVIIDDSNNLKANSFAAVGETKTHYISTDSNVGGTNAFRITRYSNSGTYEATPFQIDVNGNLGISITPSSWTTYKSLELGAGNGIHASNGVGQELHISNNAYYNSGYKYALNHYATDYKQEAGGHYWRTAPSGTAGNAITWTNAMTLDNNGKLIFGSNTFGARISITGDYASYGDTHITFRNNPTTNYGNIIFQNAAGTQVGYIQTSSTATAYITSSDYRLKDDIKPMSGSIERVMGLKPCNFVWKETGHRVDGFIAHELQEVVPEAATGVKDEMMEEEYEISPVVEATYDEEGNELTPRVEAVIGKRQVPKYQGIDQSKLVPLLTSALQDAIVKIESLERRIETLEAK